MALHLTLKMTTAQVVKMSVTNNSLSKDYSHPELDSEDDYLTQVVKMSVTNNSLSKDYPRANDLATQIISCFML